MNEPWLDSSQLELRARELTAEEQAQLVAEFLLGRLRPTGLGYVVQVPWGTAWFTYPQDALAQLRAMPQGGA